MNVSIIGAGYVGLVTGVCLAEKGHNVICVDVDPIKVDQINQAVAPIHEQGLPELLKQTVNKTLRATTNLAQAVQATDLTLIAVGTPFDGREIDLTYIKEAALQIGLALRAKQSYHLVVVKSTVVPGTTDQVVSPILAEASGKQAGVEFGVGMNPEFLTEGVAVRDFMFPDRIVLGGMDERSRDVLTELYTAFSDVPKIRTNNKTAEMIKYTSNALLATMISFSNEIANLAARLRDIDSVEVMQAMHNNLYLTVKLPSGERLPAPITGFLEAGCGFGGSCLPKDVKALIAHGQKVGLSMQLLDAVITINEVQHRQVLTLLHKHFPSLAGVRVAVLGLAFKPDTDDMRLSPAIPIIEELLAEGAIVQAYDPVANREAQKVFGTRITFCDNLPQVLTGVQAVALVTRWEEFRQVPGLLAELNPPPVFVDGRRMLDKHFIPRYEGIGL
ncbi:MAG TPA: UDP-glucose/GDP-mannose dehydrogenase family protein [Anaerolineae bacterium]|nr:UDP-glucose/GDP-mannose dehydrogenase family protein [Anaerolineae bacterium]